MQIKRPRGNYGSYVNKIDNYDIRNDFYDSGEIIGKITNRLTKVQIEFPFRLPKFQSKEEVENYLLLQ